MREFASVTRIASVGTGWRVTAGEETIDCSAVVLAGGAWNSELARQVGCEIPVSPVKGQILALRTETGAFGHTVYAHDIYVVPRPDGRVVVGATEEPGAGFDVRTQAGDVEALRQRAVALVPALADAPLDGLAWAGLRPASPDGLPVLGELPERPGVHVAAGHFRNGILLAPVTGEIVAQGILRGKAHPLLMPEFRPERFAL